MFGLIHRKTGDASTLRKRQFWQRFSGDSLFKLIIMVSAFSISYEGMSQGIAGAVTVAPEFIYRMGFGDAAGNVTKPTLQGGIVSIYYAGSLFGGFFAGSFRSIFFLSIPFGLFGANTCDSDKYGRIAGIRMAAMICFIGVVLQTAAIGLPMILVARVVAGVGVSFILCIAPAWTAELSPAAHRGDTIALTFLANFSGIALAAWIGFATSFSEAAGGQFRWRFCFATQLIPVSLITVGTFLIPEVSTIGRGVRTLRQSLTSLPIALLVTALARQRTEIRGSTRDLRRIARFLRPGSRRRAEGIQ